MGMGTGTEARAWALVHRLNYGMVLTLVAFMGARAEDYFPFLHTLAGTGLAYSSLLWECGHTHVSWGTPSFGGKAPCVRMAQRIGPSGLPSLTPILVELLAMYIY